MDCIITELHGIKRKTKNKYNIGILIKMQNVQVTRLGKKWNICEERNRENVVEHDKTVVIKDKEFEKKKLFLTYF